jgi:hypothetical protein
MSNVMNDNGPEMLGSLFEKCNNSNYNLKGYGNIYFYYFIVKNF